jgi:hypothetical protein
MNADAENGSKSHESKHRNEPQMNTEGKCAHLFSVFICVHLWFKQSGPSAADS